MIDTNVMVSALIQRSYPYRIIYELFVEDKFSLYISSELLKEYFEVLSRPKFLRYPDFFQQAERLLADIELKARMVEPSIKLDLLPDKDDNKVLELAFECRANFIITGNTTDFTSDRFHETQIVSPREYWEKFRPNYA